MAKILVVNNDVDTMSLLKKWLEKKQHEVAYTANEDMVMKMIKEFDPDLMLVDVLQKDVVYAVKNDKTISHIPIVLMTGHTLRQETIDVPVDDVIEKPFNPYLLENKIDRLIL
jgi:DNA-binding response OmpR family regulator